jgi:hypothetical protein
MKAKQDTEEKNMVEIQKLEDQLWQKKSRKFHNLTYRNSVCY